MALYAERDIADDPLIAKHFVSHMSAMTEEELFNKVDIASELAYRDAEIERMKKALNRALEIIFADVLQEEK
ncbi:MAG: hypothetical protein LC650_04555 [Actinobacteria bacterium]|nr:hypothetical protein [Actinomycetota bacterium]